MDHSLAVVDQTGKVTISLGGSCRLRCAHCYITAPQFRFTRNLSVGEAINALNTTGGFDTVCISGDTDPFLKESSFSELLERIVQEIKPTAILFTSRLIPSEETIALVGDMAAAMRSRGGLLIPCVSFVTARHPNSIEDGRRVPTATARAELMGRFRNIGTPTFAALRPIFPFELVPRSEVEALIALVQGVASCVLGEVFLLDGQGVIAQRLSLPAGAELEVGSPLTFLDQGDDWEKRSYAVETAYAKKVANNAGLPYFLRSMSAVRFLKQNWDIEMNEFNDKMEIPTVGCYDHLAP